MTILLDLISDSAIILDLIPGFQDILAILYLFHNPTMVIPDLHDILDVSTILLDLITIFKLIPMLLYNNSKFSTKKLI
jgi:hypothetical protein